MSEKKTKITHSQDKARFLGYDITTAKNSALMQSSGHTEMPIQAVGQEQPVPDDKGASGEYGLHRGGCEEVSDGS